MKKETKLFLGVTALAGITSYLATGYLAVRYATKRDKQREAYNATKNHRLKKEDQIFVDNAPFETLEITAYDDIKLKGYYLPVKDSDKIVILVHGYHSTPLDDFGAMLRFYHHLGYNILLPVNRAHGESEGEAIGFGYIEKLDVMEWIHEIQSRFNFKPLQIVLHGMSMGASTVLMLSGETLSQDVKAIISDCGFTTALEEFKSVLDSRNIPSKFILPTAQLVSSKITGYQFKEADALKQVRNSHTPTLFIHGDDDHFVPVYMAYELFRACSAEKDLLIVEGADHADCYTTDAKLYQNTIKNFLKKYIL